MGISVYKIKKWTNMLLGKSVHHVCQDEGKVYSVDEVKGYYNNLTEKVIRFGLNDNEVPKTHDDTGEAIYFSIAIFQYGLAAYDLYLMNDDATMLKRALVCADWAVDNQQEDGSWVTFAHKNPEKPYSAMAQGEGISLLVRAYIATGDQKYLDASHKAKDFMLLPIENGGTARYEGDDLYLYEATFFPLVLNGWIFSLWGLVDYCKINKDENVTKALNSTLETLKKKLPEFDIGYWSKYDDKKRICSPFYHKLHIAQLRVMYDLTKDEIYKKYADKWEKYQNSFVNRKRAFAKKVLQKVFE